MSQSAGELVRYAAGSVLLVVSALLITACGSGPFQINEAPPMPPTATPLPPQHQMGLEGEVLVALSNGREAAPPDQRYTFLLPADWTAIEDSTVELAWQSRVGGHTYSVSRESLPDGVQTVNDWVESIHRSAGQDDIETFSLEPVQVSGTQAMRWVYRATMNGEEILVHQVFLIDTATGFVLTGTTPATSIEDALALFDPIAGSFSLPRG